MNNTLSGVGSEGFKEQFRCAAPASSRDTYITLDIFISLHYKTVKWADIINASLDRRPAYSVGLLLFCIILSASTEPHRH